MYKGYQYKKDKKIISSALFGIFLGVVLGSILYYIYFFLCGYDIVDFQDMGNVTALNEKGVVNLTIYIVKKRIILLFLFIFGLSICSSDFIYSVFFGGFGLFYSLFTCYYFLHYKFEGLLKAYSLLFPHFIFYFFAILIIGSFFLPENTSSGLYSQKKKKKISFQIFKIIVTIFLLVLGIYFEIHSGNLKNFF